MDNRASGIWMVIVFLSIVFLWVLELNGTIDRVLQSEKMAASQRKEDKLKYALEDQKQSMQFDPRNRVGSKFDDGQLTDDADESKSLDDIIKMNEYYLSELEKSRGSSEPAPAPAAGHLKGGSEQSANQDMKQNDGMELEPLRVHISEDDLYERQKQVRRRRSVTLLTLASEELELEPLRVHINEDNLKEHPEQVRQRRAVYTVPANPNCNTQKQTDCEKEKDKTEDCTDKTLFPKTTDHDRCKKAHVAACEYESGCKKECEQDAINAKHTECTTAAAKIHTGCTAEANKKTDATEKAKATKACDDAKTEADKRCDGINCDSVVKKTEGGGSGEERERENCNPIPPRGEAPSRKHEPHLPPCKLFPPPEIEPIPAHLYGGTLAFGANTCWTMYKIADVQAKGIKDYPPDPPETERPELPGTETKYKNVHAGVESKADQIDQRTCMLSKGLECIEHEEIDEHGVKVKSKSEEGTCGCMSAFGGKPEERLQINGTCYIRAEAGDMSICFGDIGLPLPSGDTYYKDEWNTVKLPCAPGSICIESSLWTGKRCTCKKGYELEEGGTCSFAVSTLTPTSIFQLMLVILAVVSAW